MGAFLSLEHWQTIRLPIQRYPNQILIGKTKKNLPKKFLPYQDFNFHLSCVLSVSPLRFGEFPSLVIIFAITWQVNNSIDKRFICDLSKSFFILTCNFLSTIQGFKCSVDEDCHQGYCNRDSGKCFCLSGNSYKDDCSISGCKYDMYYQMTSRVATSLNLMLFINFQKKFTCLHLLDSLCLLSNLQHL